MFWQFPNNVQLCLLKFGGERERERERARAHDQYFQEAWDILKDLRTHWEEGESEINSKGISQII